MGGGFSNRQKEDRQSVSTITVKPEDVSETTALMKYKKTSKNSVIGEIVFQNKVIQMKSEGSYHQDTRTEEILKGALRQKESNPR